MTAFLKSLFTGNLDGFQILNKINGALEDLASRFSIPAVAVYAAGLVLALVVGLFGYKLVKLLTALALGGVGYVVGATLSVVLKLNNLFDWFPLVFGGVAALVFLILGWKKFSYVIFAAVGVVGFYAVSFYFGSRTLAVGAAVLLAMLSVIFFHFAVTLGASFAGGAVATYYAGKLLPGIEFLQFGKNKIAFFVAVAVILVLFVIQFASTRKKKA